MNEAEPNVALGKVRGDAPTNADAAHSRTSLELSN
jgi:hypothetical protein